MDRKCRLSTRENGQLPDEQLPPKDKLIIMESTRDDGGNNDLLLHHAIGPERAVDQQIIKISMSVSCSIKCRY